MLNPNRPGNLTMSTTGLVIVIVFVLLALYDLCCVVFTGVSSSISQYIVATTHISPLFTLSVGVLIGHLFCNMWPDAQIVAFPEEIPPKEFYSVADNAHFCFGAAVILGAHLWANLEWPAAGAIIAWAAVKEGWWDKKFESKIVAGSGWRDFLGYALGVLVALGIVWASPKCMKTAAQRTISFHGHAGCKVCEAGINTALGTR